MASETAIPAPGPSLKVIANAFIQQYYNVLHQSPDEVYRFYEDTSCLSRSDSDGTMTLTTTLKAINEKILSMGVTDYRIEIETADSQFSYYNGVLILVTGLLIGKIDNKKLKFTQSFFLAPRENASYFILNDVLRFFSEKKASESDQLVVNNTNGDSSKVLLTSGTEGDVDNGEETITPSESGISGVEDETARDLPLNVSVNVSEVINPSESGISGVEGETALDLPLNTSVNVSEEAKQDSPLYVSEEEKQGSPLYVSEEEKQDSPFNVSEEEKQDSPLNVSEEEKQDSSINVSQGEKEDSPMTVSEGEKQDSSIHVSQGEKEDSPITVSEGEKQDSPINVSQGEKEDSPITVNEGEKQDSLINMTEEEKKESLVKVLQEEKQQFSEAVAPPQENAPKKSYAEIVKAMKGSPLSSQLSVTSTKANIKANTAAAITDKALTVPEKPAPAPAPAPVTTKLSGNSVSENNNSHDVVGHSVYVGNLPLDTTVEQLEEEFKKFGPISHGGVQIRSNKIERFCFGFVEFVALESMQAAVKASPMNFGGRRAFIEEKRTTRRVNGDGAHNGNSNARRGGRFQSGRDGLGSESFRGRESYGRNMGNKRSEFRNRGEYSGRGRAPPARAANGNHPQTSQNGDVGSAPPNSPSQNAVSS